MWHYLFLLPTCEQTLGPYNSATTPHGQQRQASHASGLPWQAAHSSWILSHSQRTKEVLSHSKSFSSVPQHQPNCKTAHLKPCRCMFLFALSAVKRAHLCRLIIGEIVRALSINSVPSVIAYSLSPGFFICDRDLPYFLHYKALGSIRRTLNQWPGF